MFEARLAILDGRGGRMRRRGRGPRDDGDPGLSLVGPVRGAPEAAAVRARVHEENSGPRGEGEDERRAPGAVGGATVGTATAGAEGTPSTAALILAAEVEIANTPEVEGSSKGAGRSEQDTSVMQGPWRQKWQKSSGVKEGGNVVRRRG